ncbi:MAG: NAD-dependent epimerase/dehydratase family protein [Nocardioidaceae bacterium]|nr:NAD-dependent epimerase/dehydratase family protein [Nocardioidaceae bacterium]
MGGRTVLITGVSRDLGRTFARSLAESPGIDRVVGVDVTPPRGDLGAASFVRADIRNPVMAKIIAKEDVDAVVHMSVIATPGSAGARGTMKELNVIGTMQLLAACQKSERVRQVLVKSSTTAYAASSRDPAMFTEDMEPRSAPRTGYAKDVADVEGYVRGFARRRPDVAVTILRCANVIGPRVVSPLASYLRLPVIPTVLGFDPRLQFLHEHDLVSALGHAVANPVPGTFNVAGDGVLMLSQALRRMQRPSLPLPAAAFGGARATLHRARLAELPPELLAFLTYGRGVDTTRMRTELGFVPRYTTASAFEEFAATLSPTGGRTQRAVGALAERFPARPAMPPSRLAIAGGDDG